MARKYRDVRRLLRHHGFVVRRTTGSHEVWIHPDGRRATLPGGGKDNRDLAAGTLAQIRRSTGTRELR